MRPISCILVLTCAAGCAAPTFYVGDIPGPAAQRKLPPAAYVLNRIWVILTTPLDMALLIVTAFTPLGLILMPLGLAVPTLFGSDDAAPPVFRGWK